MSSGQQLLRSPEGGEFLTDNNVSPEQMQNHPLTGNSKQYVKSTFFKDLNKDPHTQDKALTQKKVLKLDQLDSQDNEARGPAHPGGHVKNQHSDPNVGTPTSGVRLLQKKESIRTERGISGNQEPGGSNSIKDDLNAIAPLQKLQTLRSNFRSSDKDLKNKHVETNIDPGIIQGQEELKEHDKLDGEGRKQQNIDQDSQAQQEEGKSQKSKSGLNRNSTFANKGRKSDLFTNIAHEEEDVLDLKLNLDEEPITQGSLDQVLKVEEVKPERCIFSHASKFRIFWDLWIILLVLFNCVQIPLQLAFQQLSILGLDTFGYIVDCQFVIDITLNFRTSYINEKTGLEVKSGKSIAKKYVTHWRFYVDVISVIPFELLYDAFTVGQQQTNKNNLKVFDLMKLVRLLRLGRIITYLKLKQDANVGFRIFQLIFMLLLVVHWISCAWYMLIVDQYWIPPKDANNGATDFYVIDMWSQFSVCYYYSIILLFGGDILPVNNLTTVFGFLVVIIGSITTAFIFGNMAALMLSMSQKDQQFQEQFESISNLMRAIRLPPDVQEEVEKYLLHIQQVPDMQSDMKIFFKLLSPSLRSSILFHLYSTIISKIGIFKECSNIEIRYFVNFMKTVIFLPGDEIIRQGDKGSKVYFISRGKVQVYIGPDDQLEDQKQAKKEDVERIISQKANQNMETGNSSPRSGRSALIVNVEPDHSDNAQNENHLHQAQFEGGEADLSPSPSGRRRTLKQKESTQQITGAVKRKASSFLGNALSASEHASNGDSQSNAVKLIKELDEGDYFGEISLITHLKRTATIKSKDFTTLGYMMARNFQAAKEEFPQIYHSFKKEMKDRYKDENFKFRQNMISNVPYFRNLSPLVIQELIYLLRPSRYDPNMLIVKRGDSTDKIYFIKAGTVDVEVPLKNKEKMKFESLNPGSCFCIFSAFHEDKKQKFDFRSRTVCVVESILAKDIIGLQKEYLELSDEIKTLMVQIENNEKSEFDFFRYLPKRPSGQFDEQRKQIVRKKFRVAIAKFFKKLKQSKALFTIMNLKKDADKEKNQDALYDHILYQEKDSDEEDENDERKHFKALRALDKLEKERRDKEQKLKYLKEKCSNPSLFALTNLLSKKKMSLPIASKSKDQIYGDGDVNSVDQLDPGDEMKEGLQVQALQRNFDYNHSQSFIHNPMNDESVEIDAQNLPRIDGIRRELLKMKDEGNFNTDDLNEISILNNVSYKAEAIGFANQKNPLNSVYKTAPTQSNYNHFRAPPTSQHQGSNMISSSVNFPDNLEVKQVQPDDSIQKMVSQSNEPMQTQENKNEINLNDIFLDEKGNPFEDLNQQPSWRKKMIQLNLHQILEENKKDKEEKSQINSPVMMKKRTKFDNIALKKEEEQKKVDVKSENQSVSNDPNMKSMSESKLIKQEMEGETPGQEELVLILSQINQSLLIQQQSMNSLQKEMGKRMHKLERKIQKAINIENGEEASQPMLTYSKIPKSPTVRVVKGVLKHSSIGEQEELVQKQSSSEKKRLDMHAHKLSSIYNNSDYQFIKGKNQLQQSPLPRVQSLGGADVKKGLDFLSKEPPIPLSSKGIQPYGGLIGQYSHRIGDGTSNQPPKKQGTLNTPNKLQVNMMMEENKNYSLQSKSKIFQSREGINNTPYFVTEYQDTIVDHNLPLVPNMLPNVDELSEKASTINKELAQTGPEVTQSMQINFKKEFETKGRRKGKWNPTSGGGFGTMGHNNISGLNLNDSQEIIDINQNDANQNQDNTVIFEEQLDKSMERFNQKEDENRMKFQVELALQIYACWPPNQQNLVPGTPSFQNQGSNQFSGRLQQLPTIQASSTPRANRKNSNQQITINNTNNINNLTIRNNYPPAQQSPKQPSNKQ